MMTKNLENKILKMCDQILDILIEHGLEIEEAVDITADVAKEMLNFIDLT